MRLFISIDMEGIPGVITPEQLVISHADYGPARRCMQDSLAAVIEGARAAGVADIVVADSHGSGINILANEMPKGTQLVSAWPRPLGMAQGVEEGSFVGAALIGYHSGISSAFGGLAHTLSGAILDLRINGRPISEATLTAAICGHFGVPVIFFAGDDQAVKEARSDLGSVDAVTTKYSYGYTSCRSKSPIDVQEELRAGMQHAIEGRKRQQPLTMPGPLTMDLHLRDRRLADVLAYLPNVSCSGSGQHVRIMARDILEASRWLMFLISIRSQSLAG